MIRKCICHSTRKVDIMHQCEFQTIQRMCILYIAIYAVSQICYFLLIDMWHMQFERSTQLYIFAITEDGLFYCTPCTAHSYIVYEHH